MKLRNLKKAPFEIATLLAANSNIVRLLYDDTPTVLADKKEFSLSIKDLIEQNYIGFYPATEAGIKEIDKNTFIIISLEDFNFTGTDNNTSASGAIYITTDKSHCLLNENRLRMLELVDEIEETLENKKLSSAGQLSINSANYVVFSDFRSGYRINFRIYDQPTRKAEL
jgi:hypothetical protein